VILSRTNVTEDGQTTDG